MPFKSDNTPPPTPSNVVAVVSLKGIFNQFTCLILASSNIRMPVPSMNSDFLETIIHWIQISPLMSKIVTDIMS